MSELFISTQGIVLLLIAVVMVLIPAWAMTKTHHQEDGSSAILVPGEWTVLRKAGVKAMVDVATLFPYLDIRWEIRRDTEDFQGNSSYEYLVEASYPRHAAGKTFPIGASSEFGDKTYIISAYVFKISGKPHIKIWLS